MHDKSCVMPLFIFSLLTLFNSISPSNISEDVGYASFLHALIQSIRHGSTGNKESECWYFMSNAYLLNQLPVVQVLKVSFFLFFFFATT